MKTIWKFPLLVEDRVDVEMPKGARILDVQEQRGTPHLWAVVEPDAEAETRRFVVAGTGNALPDLADDETFLHVATFQLYRGGFVGHVFEITRMDGPYALVGSFR